jgi:hypothetical protein
MRVISGIRETSVDGKMIGSMYVTSRGVYGNNPSLM